MATNLVLLLPIFSLLFLAAAVSARPGRPFHPCNTLMISTYSFSLRHQNPNPNSDFIIMDLRPFSLPPRIPRRLPRGPRLPILGHRLTPFDHRQHFPSLRHGHFISAFPGNYELIDKTDIPRPTEMTDLPLGFSSFRDRTKDILSVVASLLFGAACGALTAGTMYLIWSIINCRHGNYSSFDSDTDDDDADDDLYNPKKSHYVAIPASAPVKEKDPDSATPAVAAAKETV